MSVLIRNNVTTYGTGTQPMLFLHGYGCDQNMWRFVAPAFAASHQVVLFDNVGAGGSDWSAYDFDKYATLYGYADDLLQVANDLSLRNVVFVGHSVSAMIGLLAAIAQPDLFSKLIMVCPSPSFIDDGAYRGGFTAAQIDELLVTLDSNYLGWSRAMAPVIMGNDDRPELSDELATSFCRTDPAIAKAFAKTTFLSDLRADLRFCKVPTLVVQCAHDVLAPVSVGEYVDAQIPNSQLAILNVSGHCPNLSAPAETIAAIKTFLSA